MPVKGSWGEPNAGTKDKNNLMTTIEAHDTLRPRQDGHHFPGDIFIWIFVNENVWISIEISSKFVPSGPINDILALVQIIAWRRRGD